jgi:NAD(P)-dependent dehydrogenase (short-subunit alcohol dehydrogenase family)
MLFSLKGKVALVTGASRGIGRAIATGFANFGADVAVTSRRVSDLESVAEEIETLGRKSFAVAAHIGKPEEINHLIAEVTRKFGRIDILVNNAAASPAMTPLLDADERLWDSIMNVNLKGVFFLSQGVARIMKENGGGRIINVSSMDGLKPDFNIGIYAVSKAGIIMATKVMAKEWAKHNIRVNSIAPGYVRTRLSDSFFSTVPDVKKKILERTLLGRIAEPDEMVGATVYLASDASSFMTGETLVIDGGILLG